MLLVSTAGFIICSRTRNYELIRTSSSLWEQAACFILCSRGRPLKLRFASRPVTRRYDTTMTGLRGKRSHVAWLRREDVRGPHSTTRCRGSKRDITRCSRNILKQTKKKQTVLLATVRWCSSLQTSLYPDARKTEHSENERQDPNPLTTKKLLIYLF